MDSTVTFWQNTEREKIKVLLCFMLMWRSGGTSGPVFGSLAVSETVDLLTPFAPHLFFPV